MNGVNATQAHRSYKAMIVNRYSASYDVIRKLYTEFREKIAILSVNN
jgi:hypothetical protein